MWYQKLLLSVLKLTPNYFCSCVNYCTLKWVSKIHVFIELITMQYVTSSANIITDALYKHWRRINKLRDVWQSLLQNFLKWKDKTPVFVLRDLIQSWVSSHPGSLLSHPGSRGGQTGDLLGMSCRIRQRALVSGTSVFPIDEQKWHFPEVVDNIWHRQKVLLPSESSSQ